MKASETEVLRNGSRKYKLAIVAMTLIVLGWIATAFVPLLLSSFSELINGIMAVLVIYYTGNVGNKFVVGRAIVEQVKASKTRGDKNGTE